MKFYAIQSGSWVYTNVLEELADAFFRLEEDNINGFL